MYEVKVRDLKHETDEVIYLITRRDVAKYILAIPFAKQLIHVIYTP